MSFEIGRGESVGLLGESGCGKTSMGRLLLRLEAATGGEIVFDGAERLANFGRKALTDYRAPHPVDLPEPVRRGEPALLDPLDPRRAAGECAGIRKAEHEAKIIAALELVRLPQPAQYLDRYPHQAFGRAASSASLWRARSILQPDFVVADEPMSMLDVSVRAGVLDAFDDVRERLGPTAISASATISRWCGTSGERTIVMYLGKVMEDGPDRGHRPRAAASLHRGAASPPCPCRIRTRATTRCRSAAAR